MDKTVKCLLDRNEAVDFIENECTKYNMIFDSFKPEEKTLIIKSEFECDEYPINIAQVIINQNETAYNGRIKIEINSIIGVDTKIKIEPEDKEEPSEHENQVHINRSAKRTFKSVEFKKENTFSNLLSRQSDTKKTLTSTKPHRCVICYKTYISQAGLDWHKHIHTDIKFVCDICSKVFSHKSLITAHMCTHLGLKKHKCVICNKAFSRKSSLNYHMMIHSASKKNRCEICYHSFARRYHLNRHMAIHTGIKNHKCLACNMTFLRKSDLNKHAKVHIYSKKT